MVDIWPYSQRNNGTVSDREHEVLWSSVGDGVLPNQSQALLVSTSGSGYVVNPGRILVAGHVVDVETTVNGDLPEPAGATRRCLVVAYVDHSNSPWTYGVDLLQGSAGGGRPSVSASLSGRYEVVLRQIDVHPSGEIDMHPDERKYLGNSGIILPPTVQTSDNGNDTFSHTSFQSGPTLCDTSFRAPESGRVKVTVGAMARSGSTNTGDRAIFGFSIRLRNSVGSLVYSPQTYDGPVIEAPNFVYGEITTLVSGLSPHRTYYIRTAHRTSSGAPATYAHRRLIVEPTS